MKTKFVVAGVVLAVATLSALLSAVFLMNKNKAVVYDKSSIWYADVDSSGNTETLVRGSKIGEIRGDVDKLVLALNMAAAQAEVELRREGGVSAALPKIVLKKVEQQTATVELVNTRYLTEEMGSSGAQGFLAGVTYTLTENPGITSVDFLFEAGEHAMPGVYSRESFAAYARTGEIAHKP